MHLEEQDEERRGGRRSTVEAEAKTTAYYETVEGPKFLAAQPKTKRTDQKGPTSGPAAVAGSEDS